jgi:hypothetical protein
VEGLGQRTEPRGHRGAPDLANGDADEDVQREAVESLATCPSTAG